MTSDDDIAAQLPDPPPPAPLRRQAAIGEALRRYDAAHGGQPMAEPLAAAPAREAWWARIGRPQAAALVTAALIALVGVPAAWLSVSQRSGPVSQAQLASADSVMVDRAAPRLALEPTSDAVANEASPAAVPAPAAASMPQQPMSLAKDEARESEAREMPQAVAAPAAPVALARAEPAAPAETNASIIHAKQAYAEDARRVDRAAAPTPPAAMVALPPPPPPAVMVASADAVGTASSNFAAAPAKPAAKARERDDAIVAGRIAAGSAQAGPVIATAKRRTMLKAAGRGDWNACTIDDPARSLDKCRGQINPGAAGPGGRAAAHVADGLMRAWQGDLDGAIANFDRAITLSPRDATAYLNRGLALQRKGEFSRAAADLDRAVRYAPSEARGHYYRSLLLSQRGEADRAKADADRAVALDPDYVAVVK